MKPDVSKSWSYTDTSIVLLTTLSCLKMNARCVSSATLTILTARTEGSDRSSTCIHNISFVSHATSRRSREQPFSTNGIVRLKKILKDRSWVQVMTPKQEIW